MSVPARGFFLAFEGGEGTGKTTQLRVLSDLLAGRGFEIVVTHEPGDTPVGQRLRELLLDPATSVTAQTEALLYAADRAEHVAHVIAPALARGAIVISDRYLDSSIAYQGYGRGLDIEQVTQTSLWASGGLLPDLTLLLDLDPEVGLRRARGRNGRVDRLEGEALDFHTRVREGFLALAGTAPQRYAVVDASLAPDQVADDVLAAVNQLLARLPSTS
ncbi:MAG: thymidylate kinase [Mycobacterium sp.]|nr:thymidylate kinase [Mycobacterium sp.]